MKTLLLIIWVASLALSQVASAVERVNINVGSTTSTTSTGVAATSYKATQGKSGSAFTLKPK